MRCKAITKSGKQCKNSVSHEDDYCHAHSKIYSDIPKNSFCSFCYSSLDETFCLIQGPNVYICDECLDKSISMVWKLDNKDNDNIMPRLKKIIGFK